MISKYISTWWTIIFYIWLLGYTLKIKTITENINIYYITILLFFGFIGINFYYTQYLHRTFNPFLWLMLLYYHISPLIIVLVLNERKHEGALKTLVVSIILYIFHMIYIKESMYNTYFIEKIPKDFEEINTRCKSEKNKDKFFCILNSYKTDYL